jgi:hypothetical protein
VKKLSFSLLFLVIIYSIHAQNKANTSISMLNYLATETRLIVSSKNNRLVLEERKKKLKNNTNPDAIDNDTKTFLETLLNSIDKFRMLGVQRERLEYIFENQKSQAITQSLPNPLYLLGSKDLNPLSLIATIAVMTVDSIFKFQGAVNNAEMSYLKDGWDLDDKETETLNYLENQAFFYMRDIVVNNNLVGKTDSLNEESIDIFVRNSLDENLQRRRQWFENNRSLYAKYAPYWLALADTYYDLQLYKECIDSVQQYEKVQAEVFRKERDFAKILPKVIMAISQVYGTNQTYVNMTSSYLSKLLTHLNDITAEDWALRYFAAQAYIRMAGISDKRANLTSAYNLLVQNITLLSHEQEKLLAKYITPIDETIPKGTTKEKEKKMKKVISELKNQRKKELPPLHEGLLLNYQTLLEIMKELNTSAQERNRINTIIDKSIVYKMMRHSFFNEEFNGTKRSSTVGNYYLFLHNIPLVCLFPEVKADIKITKNIDDIETVILQKSDVTYKRGNISRKGRNIDNYNVDLTFDYDNDYITDKLTKENHYNIYVTFYYLNFKYTLLYIKKAGTGHFLGVFDIETSGQVIYD